MFPDHLFVSVSLACGSNPTNGIITTTSGDAFGYSEDGGSVTNATFLVPWGIAANSDGNAFILDHWGNTIRKVNSIMFT